MFRALIRQVILMTASLASSAALMAVLVAAGTVTAGPLRMAGTTSPVALHAAAPPAGEQPEQPAAQRP